MKIVFIGAVEFSLHALKHLVHRGAEIVGVCTLKKSDFNADHVDLTRFSVQYGIPCFNADDINAIEAITWIREKNPDIIFCFGWSRLLKKELLQLAPMGVIGFHPSALPANRGRHPLIWAIALGLKESASTFFFMDEGVDSGDILSQSIVPISENDTARDLYDKVIEVAKSQIDNFLPKLSQRNFVRINQKSVDANVWRKRNKLDGTIDWRMSASVINNLVRALSKPYIGAHFLLNGQEIRIWKTSISNDFKENIEPGKVILKTVEGAVIKCGDGAIRIEKMEPLIDLEPGTYL